MARQSRDSEMRGLFRAFDADGSGYIDGKELKSTLKQVGRCFPYAWTAP